MSKTVFFVTNELSGGGAERVMCNISNYLINYDYNIKIILLNGSQRVYELDERVECIIRKKEKARDSFEQIKFLRRLMKKNKNALFISFFTHQNVYTLLASFNLRNKVLISERNDPACAISGKQGKIVLAVYKSFLCDKIVFQSQSAQKCYPDTIAKKSIIIPNPLKNGLPDVFCGERKKTVVSFGRFEHQKNYSLLIKAFAEFSKTHGDYTLELYGKGSLEEKLKGLAEKLSISDKVHFNGFCKNVHEEIIDAGMFVIPSDFEGLSNSLLEALAIGLPVISTDHSPGSAAEYITSYENGILTPVRDVEKMAQAMCFMAENPEKAQQMGMKASRLKQTLSTDNICSQWKQVFDELIS